MQIIRYDANTRLNEKTVVALGNFDGVHNGHRVLINKVISRAKQLRAKSCVITFEPHTREVIQRACLIKLTATAEKIILFEKLNVDVCVIMPFDETVAKMPKSAFQNDILRKKLNCVELISGQNQHYGNKNCTFLQKIVQRCRGKNDFTDAVISLYGENNMVVSSTEIKKLLLSAQVDEAVNLLGHPYLIMGTRVRGENVGTAIGYPTFNFTSPSATEKILPPSGVYVAQVEYKGHSLKGCLYYGDCPTFEDRQLRLEFFSLDEIEIEPAVGDECALWLHRFIRHDKKFDSAKELTKQISADVKIIKRYFFKE